MNGLAHPLQTFGRLRVATRARLRRPRVAAVLSPPGVVVASTFTFIAISAWWLAVDTRVPDFDSGKHIVLAFTYHDLIDRGDWTAPFDTFHVYPPLVHLVGAAATFIGGINVVSPVMAQNVVFVPLLALGCYGAGKVAFDRRVGAFAALFALGTPMVISQFHVFMLDAPMAALVAVSVWLVLASERFARTGYSLAAGAVMGLGLMTKNTFVLFVAGLILVALIRGGWRNWRNVLLVAGMAAAIAVPWHLAHADELSGFTQGATGSNAGSYWYGKIAYPERWSVQDFAWYGWNLINNQLYLPLTLVFITGLVVALARWARTRRADGYMPELIAGGFGGYFLVTLISLNDPRYTLGCLVYISVIATAWLVRSGPRVRTIETAALVCIVALNTAMVSFGLGDTVKVSLPGGPASPILERQFVIASNGYIEGGPNDDGRVLDIMKAAKRDGARYVYFDGGSADYFFFNGSGLTVFARMAGLRTVTGNAELLGKKDIFMLRRGPEPLDPPPCTRLEDGSGVFLVRGPFQIRPFEEYAKQLYCPLGRGS
jgi:hypothetical protein